jgi:hypothetical protein
MFGIPGQVVLKLSFILFIIIELQSLNIKNITNFFCLTSPFDILKYFLFSLEIHVDI